MAAEHRKNITTNKNWWTSWAAETTAVVQLGIFTCDEEWAFTGLHKLLQRQSRLAAAAAIIVAKWLIVVTVIMMKSGRPINKLQRAEKLLRVGLYDLEKTLGKGNFAIVRLGVHRLTKTKVAVKIVNKNDLDADNLKKIWREIEIMRRLSHPHIIQLYQVMESESMIYIVTEFASNGEIFDYLVRSGRMQETEARSVFAQILSAVNYCHRHGVVHRDLKAENLLLDSDMNIKLADFGFSNYYSPDNLLSTWCGSPPYAAPELFEGKRYVGPKADIWSLGVVLYVLVCGSLPFDGATLQELRSRIVECHYRIPYFLSEDCLQLLKGLLVIQPERRLSLEQITRHPWMKPGWSEPQTAKLLGKVENFSLDPAPPLSEAVIDHIVRLVNIQHEAVIDCVNQNKCDDISAMYHLLSHSWKEAEKERDKNCASLTVSSPGPPLSPTSLTPFHNPDQPVVTEIFNEDSFLLCTTPAGSGQNLSDCRLTQLSARRHTLGPGQTPMTQGLFGNVETFLNQDILPQTNLTNVNNPLVSNRPPENFTIKDPHLLKPPLALGVSGMPHGRRASDGGAYLAQIPLVATEGLILQQQSSQQPPNAITHGQSHERLSFVASGDTNSCTLLEPSPEIPDVGSRAESPNPYLVEHYLNNRGQSKRHTIATSNIPESPRKRRTGRIEPPEINPELIKEVEMRMQRSQSPHQLMPFIPASGTVAAATLDQPYPMSPITSPSKPSSSLRPRRTGLHTVKENENSPSSSTASPSGHSLLLPYSPVRRSSEGSSTAPFLQYRNPATQHTSLPSSNDTSPSLQDAQEEYAKLRSETNCAGSSDSASSGYMSPQYLRPPSPVDNTQPGRRLSDGGVCINSSEHNSPVKMKIHELYDDMYNTDPATGSGGSRRFSYPNSPVHSIGTAVGMPKLRATEKQATLAQNFQQLCLQQNIYDAVTSDPKMLVSGSGGGSITQGVPRRMTTTAVTPIRLKTPSMAHSHSFDEAFQKQDFMYHSWGKQYSIADDYMSLPSAVVDSYAASQATSHVNNPRIIVSDEMGQSEPMDESG